MEMIDWQIKALTTKLHPQLGCGRHLFLMPTISKAVPTSYIRLGEHRESPWHQYVHCLRAEGTIEITLSDEYNFVGRMVLYESVAG